MYRLRVQTRNDVDLVHANDYKSAIEEYICGETTKLRRVVEPKSRGLESMAALSTLTQLVITLLLLFISYSILTQRH